MNHLPTDFKTIRSWEGSRDRAFEELCYQLREPTPDGWKLWRPGNPDGGFEWYIEHRNGTQRGWQVKYADSVDKLLPLMRETVKSVVKHRPRCRRLTFCIPINLPDSPLEGERTSALQKYRSAVSRWKRDIEGADRIRFELLSQSDLLALLADPKHEGTAWFFWDQEVFGSTWARERLEVTADAASDRYLPDLNVELPIGAAIEGLGLSDVFLEQFQARRGVLAKAARRVSVTSGLGVTRELRALVAHLREFDARVPKEGVIAGTFDRTTMLSFVDELLPLAGEAYPSEPAIHSEDGQDLAKDLSRLSRRARELRDFLQAPAARTAESGTLLLSGEAGQGKTHLFCDAIERTVATGRPGVVVLGSAFRGAQPVADLARALGLGDVGSRRLFGAMRAAAEASSRPFVVLVDALNDAAEPNRWEHDLPLLLAEARQYWPWIRVGVSVRSTYLNVIGSSAASRMTAVEHPGLAGREQDAIERYFRAANLELPRTPLMLPEFRNPLFLKLYCDGLAASPDRGMAESDAHITAVFERYLAFKSEKVIKRLNLDEDDDVVARAISAFAQALPVDRREVIRRQDAVKLINALLPIRNEWPNTLYGALRSEGVLTEDLAYLSHGSEDPAPVRATQITFQRLSDHLTADALLNGIRSKEDLLREAESDGILHRPLSTARAGIIAALSVVLPERFGVELLDLPAGELSHAAKLRRARAFLASLVSRRSDAVSERSAKLLAEVSGQSRDLHDLALQTLVSVAPRPDHLLNGEFLHSHLMGKTLPSRDQTWTIATYDWLDNTGPIDRLIRWLRRGPVPDVSDADVELAVIPLVWCLTSPNRYLRDYVTKALATGLASRLGVVASLVQRFAAVNDPYVIQRLAVIAHGAVLMGGRHTPALAARVHEELSAVLVDPSAVPDFILRDAGRGVAEWCRAAGLITDSEYAASCPPYASDAPSEDVRTVEELEQTYERSTDATHGYSSILFSLFSLGDFGKYVVDSKSRRFSGYRHGEPSAPPEYEDLDPEQTQTLSELLRLYGAESDADMVDIRADDESPERYRRQRPDPRQTYPADLARRWVFERVVELGWSPERFGEFDRSIGRQGSGREAHKPERIGKKYQWIALRELIARLADNYRMSRELSGEPELYRGPWQFYGRDIDPTLPPPPRAVDDDGVGVIKATFKPDPTSIWWSPAGPQYHCDDPPVPDNWAEDPTDLPTLGSALHSRDDNGTEWVTLHAYLNWDAQRREDNDHKDDRRRDLWGHLYCWLVKPSDVDRATEYLRVRSFMGRWMPEGREITDAAYLGELPLAEAAQDYPAEWEPIAYDGEETDIEVYPAWDGYHWEGNVLDCSLTDSVFARTPSQLLYEAGDLHWVAGTRSWADASGGIVAHYREGAGQHSVLLVRADWLNETLARLDLALVAGFFGQKHLLSSGWSPEIVGGWSEYNALGVLRGGKWKLDPVRTEISYPARD